MRCARPPWTSRHAVYGPPRTRVPFRLLDPVLVERIGGHLVLAPGLLVRAAGRLPHYELGELVRAPADLEAPRPLEPGEVVLGASRGDAPEPADEVPHLGVEAVHPVDGVLLPLAGDVLADAEGGQDAAVHVRTVRRDYRADRELVGEQLPGCRLVEAAPPRDLVEDVAGVVDAGEHAYLLVPVGSLRPCAGLPGHAGLRPGAVSLEALPEEALVELGPAAGLHAEGGHALGHGLEQPVAHEERRLEAHAALFRRLAQREHVHVALREPHPGRPVELGGGEDAHGGVGEGPGAPSAEEPLTAAPVSPPLHVMRGAAPGAGSVGIVFRPLACREVEQLRVYQRLERSQGPALLGSRHLREELPRQLGEHVFHCNLHLS